jgi:hypothetical protein
MYKQNENNVKRTRYTSKKSQQREEFMKSLIKLRGLPVSQKRSYKATSGTTERSKRLKADVPRQTSRSTDIGESSTSVEVEDEFEKQKELENTKHYNDQQSLLNDWDREKINFINRYFMSFPMAKSLMPAPPKYLLFPLAASAPMSMSPPFKYTS